MVNQRFRRRSGKAAPCSSTPAAERFSNRKRCTGRGKRAKSAGLIIDCWENEPALDLALLHRVDFGTPHIAGYSRDGKANGTTVAVRAIGKFFGLGIDDWEPAGIEPPANPVIALDGVHQAEEAILAQAVLSTYQIGVDDATLRENPQAFEQMRGDYPVRREFSSYTIEAVNVAPEVLEKLEKLGFILQA